MSTHIPEGEEREIRLIGSVAVDGAPISYLIVLATVVTALSFVPLSIKLVLGGSFPMSQAIYGLVGWVLGPIAGPLAAGIGALVGVFLAPHTSSIPFVTVLSAVVASFAGGAMVVRGNRRSWWLVVWIYALISFLYFIGRAIFLNGIGLWPAFGASFINWSALILFALPTRKLFAQWINGDNWFLLVLGLGLGTWTVYGLAHVCAGAIFYHLFNWPEEIWISLIPIIPIENTIRAAVGVIIGGGVVAGLRAIGLVKPEHAVY